MIDFNSKYRVRFTGRCPIERLPESLDILSIERGDEHFRLFKKLHPLFQILCNENTPVNIEESEGYDGLERQTTLSA